MTASEQDFVDPGKSYPGIVTTETFIEPPIFFEIGEMQTEKGTLRAISNQTPDIDQLVLSGLGQRFPRFSALNTLRRRVNQITEGQGATFANYLGYTHQTESDYDHARPTDITYVPTAEYFNNALDSIYRGTLAYRPMTFRDAGDKETLSSKAFIESLAAGEVLLPSISDASSFRGELGGHALGYARLSIGAFDFIRNTAKQFVERPDGLMLTRDLDFIPGLTVFDKSDKHDQFAYAEPRQFLIAVERLTGLMTSYPDWGEKESKLVKKHLYNIVQVTEGVRPIMRGFMVRMLNRNLINSQQLLEKRAQELQTSK